MVQQSNELFEPDVELLGVVWEDEGEDGPEDGEDEDDDEEDPLEAEEGRTHRPPNTFIAVHQYPDRITLKSQNFKMFIEELG